MNLLIINSKNILFVETRDRHCSGKSIEKVDRQHLKISYYLIKWSG